MKDFYRPYPLFSLCGLNCALCPMHLDGYCPGCGGGAGNQPCAVARCAREHGDVEYCFQCREYPCPRYQQEQEYDFVITTQHQLYDLERARTRGLERYRAELEEKAGLLSRLLAGYNDGRKKTLYCVAVNLLPLEEVKAIVDELTQSSSPDEGIKARAARAAALLQAAAQRHNILLKLRRRPRGKPDK